MQTGSKEDQEKLTEAEAAESTVLLMGWKEKVIPLNGGSQTRRDIKMDFREMYRDHPFLEVICNGWSITIRKKRNGKEEVRDF